MWFFLQGLNLSSSRFSKQSLFSAYDFWNSFHFQVFWCKNNELREFLLFFLRLIFLIPQSATFIPFFTPITATSHFSLFGFSPGKKDNSSRINSSTYLLNFHVPPSSKRKRIEANIVKLFVIFLRSFYVFISCWQYFIHCILLIFDMLQVIFSVLRFVILNTKSTSRRSLRPTRRKCGKNLVFCVWCQFMQS